MFRPIQSLQPSVKLEPHFKTHQVGEDGYAELVDVPAVADFPPMENFQLDNMLKAGVPIQEVNTKVLGNRETFVDVDAVAKKLGAKFVTESGTKTETVETKEN